MLDAEYVPIKWGYSEGRSCNKDKKIYAIIADNNTSSGATNPATI